MNKKEIDDWSDIFEKLCIGKCYGPCVKCGNVFDMCTDDIKETTEGLMCRSCIEG